MVGLGPIKDEHDFDAGLKNASKDVKSQIPSTVPRTWQGVDDSKPTTSVQLRLADGSRMVRELSYFMLQAMMVVL